MRIAVSGNGRDAVVKKIATHFGVEAKTVNQPYLKGLYAYAAESYQYFDEKDVVFDGSVLEDSECDHVPTDGERELHEQITLNALQNYDRVYIVTRLGGCVPMWKYMNDLFPDKVILVDSEEDVNL